MTLFLQFVLKKCIYTFYKCINCLEYIQKLVKSYYFLQKLFLGNETRLSSDRFKEDIEHILLYVLDFVLWVCITYSEM